MSLMHGRLWLIAGVFAAAPAAAQDFVFRDLSVNNRQVLETRLGPTARPGPSGRIGAGLLSVVLTAGPVANSTSVQGALLDADTLFVGGAAPSYSSIIAQGSAFSLGGGCRLGGSTYFPLINANRPQMIRWDDGTGFFSVSTPTLAGTDQYDSVDCDANATDMLVIMSNRTRGRVEVHRYTGKDLEPIVIGGLANVSTPFEGGMRPTGSILRGSVPLRFTSSYVSDSGIVFNTTITVPTAAVDPPCAVATGPAPSSFTRVRELVLLATSGFGGAANLISGDFDEDGTSDLAIVPASGCTPTVLHGGAGSSTGGNGYNWTGYALTQPRRGGAISILWGRGHQFVTDPGAPSLANSPVTTPFANRGGPYHVCTGVDLEGGPAYVVSGAAGLNTQLSVGMSSSARVLNDANIVYQSSLEQRRFIASPDCRTPR